MGWLARLKGRRALIAIAVAAALLLGLIGFWLDAEWLPLLAVSVFFRTVLPNKAVDLIADEMQRNRPRDSYHRIGAAIVRRSIRDHPRFGRAFTEGEAHLKANRLWQSKYLGGSFDVTEKGLRWEPKDVNATVGFKPFNVPWSEIRRAVVYRTSNAGGVDGAWLWLEGGFGPSVDVQIAGLEEARKHLQSHGVAVVDKHWTGAGRA